jgi:predicted dehydrogenase
VEDLAAAFIRYDNGAVLHLEAAYSLNLKQDEGRVELFGTKGGAKLTPEIEIYTETRGYLTNLSFFNKTEPNYFQIFDQEIGHFVDCIQKGVPCRAPAEDGVQIMRILDAIYESARTKHEVQL